MSNSVERPAETELDPREWERRFKARIVERLMPEFTRDRAEAVAEDELQSTATYDARTGYENDPEGSADEALSYWGDGA